MDRHTGSHRPDCGPPTTQGLVRLVSGQTQGRRAAARALCAAVGGPQSCSPFSQCDLTAGRRPLQLAVDRLCGQSRHRSRHTQTPITASHTDTSHATSHRHRTRHITHRHWSRHVTQTKVTSHRIGHVTHRYRPRHVTHRHQSRDITHRHQSRHTQT